MAPVALRNVESDATSASAATTNRVEVVAEHSPVQTCDHSPQRWHIACGGRGRPRSGACDYVRRPGVEQQELTIERHPTLVEHSDKGNNDAAYADGAIALAVIAGVTSAVLFLTDDPTASPPATPSTGGGAPRPRSASITPSPFITSHGGGAGALVRF